MTIYDILGQFKSLPFFLYPVYMLELGKAAKIAGLNL